MGSFMATSRQEYFAGYGHEARKSKLQAKKLVDSYNALCSNREMRPLNQQQPVSRQNGAGIAVAGLPVRADRVVVALSVLLVLLLIIGRGAGSG
jgi:hypothetical protein